MMKRLVIGILGVILLSLLMINHVSAIGVNWGDYGVHEISRDEISIDTAQSSLPCSGTELSMEVVKVGWLDRSCVFGMSDEMRIARYLSDDGFKYGVSFPDQQFFYELRGLCSFAQCIYSAVNDSFLIRRYMDSPGHEIVLYKEFSRSVVRHVDETSGDIYFAFEPSKPPDYSFRAEGIFAPTEAAALSGNSKWAIFSVYDQEYIRLNMKTFEAVRFSLPGINPGRVNNQYVGLAISNNGQYVAAVGYGVKLSMYKIENECSYGAFEGENLEGVFRPCDQIPLDSDALFPGFVHGYSPHFNQVGDRLSVSVARANGQAERIVLAPTSTSGPNLEYLALGDSFTSGEGESSDEFYQHGSTDDGYKCHISVRSYPYLIAESWGLNGANIACSGARTVDVVGKGEYSGQSGVLLDSAQNSQEKIDAMNWLRAGVLRQADFVSYYQPSVITLGIGGNDAGLMGKLSNCVGTGTCEWAGDPTKKYANVREIGTLYPKLRELLRTLVFESPKSKVALVGYPQIIDSSSNAKCDALIATLLDQTEREFIKQSIIYLNQVLRAAALAERVSFIDIESSLVGSELCGKQGSASMNGVRFGDDIAPISLMKNFRVFGAESFHPTAYGHRLISRYITAQYPLPTDIVSCLDCDPDSTLLAPSDYWRTGGDIAYVRHTEDASMTDKVIEAGSKMSISTRPIVFMPNTAVSAELHSEPIMLASGNSSDDGSYNAKVSIPVSIPPGYHTVHLVGIAPDGSPVDVYNTVAVQPGESVEGAVEVLGTNHTRLNKSSGSMATAQLANVGYTGHERLVKEPADEQVLGVSRQGGDLATIKSSFLETIPRKQFNIVEAVIIAVVGLGVFVYIAILTYKRFFRHSRYG